MRGNSIDKFFVELDRALGRPAQIILTGAVAGVLMGNIRPSLDIDFEIQIRKADDSLPMDRVMKEVSQKTGLAINFSDDIHRWSMIDFLDYRKTAVPYKTIGKLKIKIMAPGHWTIGKMARFLEIDIQDVMKVIKRKNLHWQDLARLWGQALRSSPLSTTSSRFRDSVIIFFQRYGKSAWGKDFGFEKAIQLFQKTAKIPVAN